MNKNNFLYKRNENEINLYYNIRKIFIQSFQPKNKKEFRKYEMYSNIFINMLFLKCRYQTSTEKVIYNFLKKNKNKIYYNFLSK